MVGKLLLCSGRHSFVDARAISVVNQITNGDNPVSLILAKTLLGMDAVFHGGETQNFFDFADMADGVTGHDCPSYNQ